MDNASAHPPNLQDYLFIEIKFVKTLFLPPNNTPLLQNMDQMSDMHDVKIVQSSLQGRPLVLDLPHLLSNLSILNFIFPVHCVPATPSLFCIEPQLFSSGSRLCDSAGSQRILSFILEFLKASVVARCGSTESNSTRARFTC
ncbi:hypothetical protein AVEN_127533-1 [Araneus ventricosus]|uniref:DDE-1 domain-containing protein n=1 Tax=Araneus ventricosus TaxID=182803 RepID=A0A4Y2HRD6_ARAVE|nr:hypothetical protein AVEN_127533-1 [Araneus ventricosus]